MLILMLTSTLMRNNPNPGHNSNPDGDPNLKPDAQTPQPGVTVSTLPQSEYSP